MKGSLSFSVVYVTMWCSRTTSECSLSLLRQMYAFQLIQNEYSVFFFFLFFKFKDRPGYNLYVIEGNDILLGNEYKEIFFMK